MSWRQRERERGTKKVYINKRKLKIAFVRIQTNSSRSEKEEKR